MRNQQTKNRYINTEEEDRQIAENGTQFNNEHWSKLALRSKEAFEDMKERFKKGENDDRMQTTALGLRIGKAEYHENHEDRWKRQHEIVVKIDELKEKQARMAFNNPEFPKLKEEIAKLERAL